jgi:phosphoribosylaminoimidazolecarboxamide formyltransferase/IMP cyclohydrolase
LVNLEGYMFKNALISVSDKTGLIEFLKPMIDSGLRVVSTGGTYQHLKDHGLPVVEISEQTEFPEVMGGRVKTLHPMVHMGLLSREGFAEDAELLKKYKLQPFDLLICNLYPFEASVVKGIRGQDLIEKIDIGGPSMLRSAAKNFERLTVVCDPKDYSWISQKTDFNLSDRKKLAAKVFAHTAAYDTLVSQELGAGWGEEFSLAGRNTVELRYGENPQQQARWYRYLGNETGLHSAQVLQGKPLSYNNILDLDAAVGLVRELGAASCVAVKHNNPCGVASQKDLNEAIELAIKADPVSVFGGILAVNQTLEACHAEKLGEIFLECVVAPKISFGAREVFAKKKNLRILEWPSMLIATKNIEVRGVVGGFLTQESDVIASPIDDWRFLGKHPNDQQMQDLIFAEKVCASLKSNSIAIVKHRQSLGLGMGQVNRVDAVAQAIERMQNHHAKVEEVILASDAFFPFPDSVYVAAKAGVKWILQPGGSVKDNEVFAVAKDMGINMVLTGVRHFRH